MNAPALSPPAGNGIETRPATASTRASLTPDAATTCSTLRNGGTRTGTMELPPPEARSSSGRGKTPRRSLATASLPDGTFSSHSVGGRPSAYLHRIPDDAHHEAVGLQLETILTTEGTGPDGQVETHGGPPIHDRLGFGGAHDVLGVGLAHRVRSDEQVLQNLEAVDRLAVLPVAAQIELGLLQDLLDLVAELGRQTLARARPTEVHVRAEGVTGQVPTGSRGEHRGVGRGQVGLLEGPLARDDGPLVARRGDRARLNRDLTPGPLDHRDLTRLEHAYPPPVLPTLASAAPSWRTRASPRVP